MLLYKTCQACWQFQRSVCKILKREVLWWEVFARTWMRYIWTQKKTLTKQEKGRLNRRNNNRSFVLRVKGCWKHFHLDRTIKHSSYWNRAVCCPPALSATTAHQQLQLKPKTPKSYKYQLTFWMWWWFFGSNKAQKTLGWSCIVIAFISPIDIHIQFHYSKKYKSCHPHSHGRNKSMWKSRTRYSKHFLIKQVKECIVTGFQQQNKPTFGIYFTLTTNESKKIGILNKWN